jgi:hypothetical protein
VCFLQFSLSKLKRIPINLVFSRRKKIALSFAIQNFWNGDFKFFEPAGSNIVAVVPWAVIRSWGWKNLRSPFQKFSIVKGKAIFFLLENTKFIGIRFSFDRENCKKHTQIYSVLKNLKVSHFRTLTLTTADQVNQWICKRLVNIRLIQK